MSETTEALDWTTIYDAEHSFPFVEDENGNITGYGHQQPDEFAAAINAYDELCNGSPLPPGEQWKASDINHTWVTVDAGGERLRVCGDPTPGEIPATTLWNRR